MGAARSRLELDGADLEERELVERRVDHRDTRVLKRNGGNVRAAWHGASDL